MRPSLLVILTLFTISFSTAPSHAMYRNDLWIPQTRTLNPGEFQVSVERRAQFQKKKDDPYGMGHESTVGTSFGLWEKDIVGVEGGIDWIEPAGDQIGQAIYAHLRIRVSKVQEAGWGVATGIERMGFVANKNDVNIIYINLQNKFSEKWIAGVGGYNGSARFLVDHVGKEDPKGVFVGVWRLIQQGRGKLGLEHQAGVSFLGVTALGMTLEFADGIHGTVSYALANNQNISRDHVLARMSVDF